jgi:hypothetical protein
MSMERPKSAVIPIDPRFPSLSRPSAAQRIASPRKGKSQLTCNPNRSNPEWPVYVDSSRRLRANSGHSGRVWRTGQIGPFAAVPRTAPPASAETTRYIGGMMPSLPYTTAPATNAPSACLSVGTNTITPGAISLLLPGSNSTTGTFLGMSIFFSPPL